MAKPFSKVGLRKTGARSILKAGSYQTQQRTVKFKTKEPKGKRKYPGKILEKKTLKKRLIIVDSCEEEPEEILCAELSSGDCVEVSEKEIANVTEESFAVADVAKEILF